MRLRLSETSSRKVLSLSVMALLWLTACSTNNNLTVPSLPPVSAEIVNPILFVTQVPTDGEVFASRTSTFANHLSGIDRVPRGGDLMIRYPDGSLRNLTKEAGFGMDGQQGASAIAVREPSVHWSGTKALFSMLIGAPTQRYVETATNWQIFEVSGLGKTDKAVIVKVAGQPTGYNNVSPIYASDDRVLFTSDRPRDGEAHLYPQLDEYESTPTITGIWSLNPQTQQVSLLNHTPSGAFSPQVDSYGRVIFTRWDHLQRDQQADGSPNNGYVPLTFESEAQGAAQRASQLEVFPESRLGMATAYGAVNPHTYNLFTPWQMNQDGTSELTLNHIGRHEMSFGFMPQSFSGDPALTEFTLESIIANRKNIRIDGGIFNFREDPRAPGIYYGIYAREFGSMTSSQIVRFTGAPTLNAEQMVFTDATPAETGAGLIGGRYRNPLPLSTGQMVAVYTTSSVVERGIKFRLHHLKSLEGNTFEPGNPLTGGINKTVTWWSPDESKTYSGALWELEPVEVVARARPTAPTSPLEQPERNIFSQEGVSESAFRAWLTSNDLALIVSRNQTSRDRADQQQPYNLQVPGGVKTAIGAAKVYDIAHYQIFQASQLRGYQIQDGRRVIAQPMAVNWNPTNPSGPSGSVSIAPDGSSAAFVPARRALTWQTTDPNGEAVVRERVWVTMQPGEIRTCAGCHGENSSNQVGGSSPTNNPEALRRLLQHWKTLPK
jgi:Hydrazine synthase alpha subunit middle domain